MALAPAVFGEHETYPENKTEKQRIDEYQQRLSETPAFEPHEEDLFHYPNPPFQAQRPSPHSTQSRAAFGGYQAPTATGGQGGHFESAKS